MGVYAGPEITSDGLVLALDAGNSKGYPDPVNYYSTPETLTEGRVGTDSGGIYTDFTSGGPDGGRFTRWTNNTGTSGSTAWHWSIGYTNTGLSTGQPVIVSFYARCPNATVSNITLNSPDSTMVTATLDTNWRLFAGTALYGGDYVSTPFVRINRSNTSTFANGATYDIALLKVQKGNVWTDMTGRGNSGTLTNGPTYSSANGGSLMFDGTNDYISCGNILNFTTENFSFNIFFYHTSTTTNQAGQGPILFYKGAFNTNGYYIQLTQTNPSQAVFITNQSGVNQLTVSSSSLVVGSWNNVSITRSGSSVRIYINGVDATSSAGTHINPASSTDNFQLSAYSTGIFANTRIASFQAYNRALTAAEIQQNFNATRGRFGI